MKQIMCRWKPKLRPNSKGELKDSALYDAIYKYVGKNRDSALDFYFYVTSNSFMLDFKSLIKLNDLSEPTLLSLLNIKELDRNISIYKDSELFNVNKAFLAGIYTALEVKAKIDNLSRDTEYNKMFIPHLRTITDGEDAGKVEFTVVRKNQESQAELERYLTLTEFKNKLLDILKQCGINVDFAERLIENANADGVYSTLSPEKTFDNLYTLITLATSGKSNKELTKNLCEEIGHFIVGAAENSSDSAISNTMARLFNYTIDENHRADVVNSLKAMELLLGIKSNEVLDLSNSDRELLGRLIGTYLYASKENGKFINIDKVKTHWWTRLANRAIKSVFRLFKNIPIIVKNYYNVNRREKVRDAMGNPLKDLNGNYIYLYKKNQGPELLVQEWEVGIKESISNDVKYLVNAFYDTKLNAQEALKTKEERHKDTIAGIVDVNNMFRTMLTFLTKYSDKRGKDLLYKSYMNAIEEAAKARSLDSNNKAVVIAGEMDCIRMFMEDAIVYILLILSEDLNDILDPDFINRLLNSSISGLSRIKNIDKKMKILISARDYGVAFLNLIDSILSFSTSEDIVLDAWINNPIMEGLLEDLKLQGRDIFKLASKVSLDLDALILSTVNNGNAYIDRGVGIYKNLLGEYVKRSKEDSLLSIKELLKNFDEEDLNPYGIYLNPISRSTDIISLLYDKLVNYNKFELNQEMLRVKRELFTFMKDMKDALGIDKYDWAYERYSQDVYDPETGKKLFEKGEFTGNIKQSLRWGDWEAKYDYDIAVEKLRILSDYKDVLEKLNSHERLRFILDKINEYKLKWHGLYSERTFLDENGEATENDLDITNPEISLEDKDIFGILYWKPNKSFLNEEWYNDTLEFGEKQRLFINKYLAIKLRLDKKVNAYRHGATKYFRLPQFRERMITKIARGSDRIGYIKATGLAISDKFTLDIFDDILDTDFGDLTCYTTPDLSVDLNASERYAEWRRRLPVYGINKVAPKDLSTDLVHSTLCYALMATNIEALRTTALACELGEEALKERRINRYGNTKERDINNHTGVFLRFTRWLDMSVYSKYQTRSAFGITFKGKNKEIVISKIGKKLNGMFSTYILSGRVPGAIVNTGTGMVQIMKEAGVGTNFNEDELVLALKIYGKGFLGDFIANENGISIDPLRLDKTNKLYNFIAYYDALNKNMLLFSDIYSNKSRLLRALWGMWVYESGDHIMLTVPYIAKALHTKLYTTDKPIFDGTGRLTVLEDSDMREVGNLFDNFDYKELNKVAKDKTTEGDPYHMEENKYFIKTKDGRYVLFNSIEAANFADLCRYLVDDLHGIYNSKDAAALSANWIGSSMMTMKKYYLGYINSMWLSDRYSVTNSERTLGAFNALKMLLGYRALLEGGGIKGYVKTLGTREGEMAIPIIATSLACIGGVTQGLLSLGGLGGVITTLGGSTLFPIATALSYNILSRRIFGVKEGNSTLLGKLTNGKSSELGRKLHGTYGKDSYALTELKGRLGLELYLIDALKRADMQIKAFLLLLIMALLFGMGLFKVPLDEEDDNYSGFNLDEEFMSIFWPDYKDIAELYAVETLDKSGIKKNGILYNIIMHETEDNPSALFFAKQSMGMLYYILHRLRLELETLSPAVIMDLDAGNKELKTQASELCRYLPVSMSYILLLNSFVNNFDSSGNPNFKFDSSIKDAETLLEKLDIIKETTEEGSEGKEGAGIPPLGKTAGTLFMALPGAKYKGIRSFYGSLPYLNSLGFFIDAYKASDSYSKGRTMG